MSKTSRTALPLGSEKKLLAFTAGQLTLSGEGEDRTLPTRLLVMPWGESNTNKGRLIVNETTVGVLAHNQDAAKFDRVAFDFQHNTVRATPADEPVKVAGYGTPEVESGKGIFLSSIEYTDHGREALLGGDYPDISPTVVPNKKGEIIFLHSVGAVRQGEVDGLVLFEPKGKAATAMTALAADGKLSLSADLLDGDDPDWRAIALESLNLAGANLSVDAENTDILSEVARMREAKSKPTKSSPLKTMSSETETSLESRLVSLEAKQETTERQQILSDAKRDGKVIPLSAESIEKMDPGVLREMVDQLPKGEVPLGSEVEGAADTTVTLGADLSSADKSVARMMGVSEEDLKKFG